MSTMVSEFLTVLYLDWTIRLLGLTSNGACNMTGRIASVVICLDTAMHSDCSDSDLVWGTSTRSCYGGHMSNVIKERFFSVMTGFITHLTRQ
jgi:hypothetical protein